MSCLPLALDFVVNSPAQYERCGLLQVLASQVALPFHVTCFETLSIYAACGKYMLAADAYVRMLV